jgi:hypothetical protein
MPADNETEVEIKAALAELGREPRRRFADWSADKVHVEPTGWGVYTIWDDDGALVYVGIGGDSRSSPKGKGLLSRLRQHASGYRSGDRFCIYVADHYADATLTPKERNALHRGDFSLDARVREYIHAHFSYRVSSVSSIATARLVENAVKRGALKEGAHLPIPTALQLRDRPSAVGGRGRWHRSEATAQARPGAQARLGRRLAHVGPGQEGRAMNQDSTAAYIRHRSCSVPSAWSRSRHAI